MSGTHPIDHDTLAALRDVMGDEFQLLIDTYIGDSTAKIGAIQRALAGADSEAVRRAAHSLKGSCSNIGAHGLMTTCQNIEQRAGRGELAGLETLLVELQGQFSQVKSQLEIYQ